MDAIAETIELLEAHDERTPAIGVDAIQVAGQSHRVRHVHSRYADLEREERTATLRIPNTERMHRLERRFEVHRALGGAWWRDVV